MSPALSEEVTFGRNNVKNLDWAMYRAARAYDIPARIEIDLIEHPEILSGSEDEPATRPAVAAIANAIFDATGARVRQTPLTRRE
jgi:CO/xanthine dehydrogenase Mo-binding subunit